MEKANSKILTLSFALAGILFGVTTFLLLQALSGAIPFFAKAAGNDLFKHGLPVSLGIILFAVLQFTPSILVWGNEVVSEIRKVVWPSRKDTTAMTIACVVMVLISSVIISSFDLISGFFINYLMK